MNESTQRTWVWRSSEESRAAGQISVLAVIETLVCVAVYWLLWLWLGVFAHHWMILVATPLVLLRSDKSIALGLKWFNSYWLSHDFPSRSAQRVGLLALVFLVSGLASWWLAADWNLEKTGWPLLTKTIVIIWFAATMSLAVTVAGAGPSADGVALGRVIFGCAAVAGVAGVVAGGAFAVAAAETIAGVRVGEIRGDLARELAGAGILALALLGVIPVALLGVIAGLASGVCLRAITIRFAATLSFLTHGMGNLATNWRFTAIVSDSCQSPELMPGSKELTLGNTFSLSRFRKDGTKGNPIVYIVGLTVIPIFFGPAMLWRWSIKSTAWFYLPLLWARRDWKRLEGEELKVWARSYSSKALNWAWLLLGGVSFAAVTVTLFSFQKWLDLQDTLQETGAPTTVLGFMLALDWSELLKQPWLWFYIPSYVLTICVFFALDGIAKDIRNGCAAPESRVAHMTRWMWAANVRAVLTNMGLAIALLYFLDAVDAWEQTKAFLLGLV